MVYEVACILIPCDIVAALVLIVEKGKVASYNIVVGDAWRINIALPAEVALEGCHACVRQENSRGRLRRRCARERRGRNALG